MPHRPAPRTGNQAELLLKRQLQWLLLLRVLLLSLLLGISALLQARDHPIALPPLPYLGGFIGIVYLCTIGSAWLLGRIRDFSRFAYLQVAIDILLTGCLIFFTGLSQSVFTVVLFLPIFAGGFLLFRAGGLLSAALATLMYGSLLLLEYSGYASLWYPPLKASASQAEPLLHAFAITGISFFLVGILSATLAERLHRTEAALSQTASNYDRLALLYKQIFDDISTGIITVDDQGLITSFNRAAETITGYPAGEVLGRQLSTLFPGLRPMPPMTDRPMTRITTKDGEVIPVGYSWARLHSRDGNENCRVFTMQDLSQIKKMELQVRQAEKMAAVGEMAAGIAHEFRNPLAAISGSAQLLGQRLADQPASRRLSEIIIRECDRLEKVIKEFLQFSRPHAPEKRWFSLPMLVREACQLLEQAPAWQQGRLRLECRIPPDLECWADPEQLRQVLLNLLANACQAMAGRDGTIRISGREEPGDPGQLVISIRDSGPGIAEADLGRIFDPYFTTREDGTGLGLAIVHQIVESHDGRIEAASEEGRGACFTIWLPMA